MSRVPPETHCLYSYQANGRQLDALVCGILSPKSTVAHRSYAFLLVVRGIKHWFSNLATPWNYLKD